MKKIINISLIITTIINALGCYINLLCATLGDFLLIKIYVTGGEYVAYRGFGIVLEHIYPLMEVSREPSVIKNISFDFINFLFCFVIIFIVVFIITSLISKKKRVK